MVFRMENPTTDRPTWNPQRISYPGLSAFSEADAPAYFGRDAQIAELIRRLHASTRAKWIGFAIECEAVPSDVVRARMLRCFVPGEVRFAEVSIMLESRFCLWGWRELSAVPSGVPQGCRNACGAVRRLGTTWGPHVVRDRERPAEMRSRCTALRARIPRVTCGNMSSG
jgi:hypothetical protein